MRRLRPLQEGVRDEPAEIVGKKAKNVSKECMRCPVCMEACPKGAVKLLKKENLGKALASASCGVLSTFGKNKASFVSFAENITRFCDCVPAPGNVVMGDIGIFASSSPVSVDAAFLQRADYKISTRPTTLTAGPR